MQCVSRRGSRRPSRRADRRRARVRARARAASAAAAGKVDTAASRRSACSPPGARRTRAPLARRRSPRPRSSSGSSAPCRQAERECAGTQRHHCRGRALPGLDPFGRDAGDLLEQQRGLERRRPRRSAAEDDRACRRRPRRRSSTHERAPAIVARARRAAARAHRPGPESDVTLAQTPSAATTAPQNACVCVTARWFGTETSARASAREPSVEPGLAVTAAYGARRAGVDRLDQVAEFAGRGDGEQHVARPPRERLRVRAGRSALRPPRGPQAPRATPATTRRQRSTRRRSRSRRHAARRPRRAAPRRPRRRWCPRALPRETTAALSHRATGRSRRARREA